MQPGTTTVLLGTQAQEIYMNNFTMIDGVVYMPNWVPGTARAYKMVERFNRRLSEAIRSARPNRIAKNRFETHEQRNTFVLSFVYSYNRTR